MTMYISHFAYGSIFCSINSWEWKSCVKGYIHSQIVLHKDCSNFHFHQRCRRKSLSPHPTNTVSYQSLISANGLDAKWHFLMVVKYISPTGSDVEFHFTCFKTYLGFLCWEELVHIICLFSFSFIFISWRLITLQYCSGFCHTLTWISHGFICISHPDPPSHLPLDPIPLGLSSAPGLSTRLMHPTWAGDLFHPGYICLFLKLILFKYSWFTMLC